MVEGATAAPIPKDSPRHRGPLRLVSLMRADPPPPPSARQGRKGRRSALLHLALDLRHLFARQLSLLGCYMGTFAELREAAQLLFDDRVRPVIDRVFPLAEAVEAQRRLEAKGQFGKIVLQIA